MNGDGSIREPPLDEALAACPAMQSPTGVLLCPPNHYEVVDVKNPHMEGQRGRVDGARARAQWEGFRDALAASGLHVDVVDPLPGAEDMVFTANPTLTGLLPDGRFAVMPSAMRHPSRRPEVAATVAHLAAAGAAVRPPAPAGVAFEGGGDAVWHPGRRLLWVGHGPRSDDGALGAASRAFGVPAIALELVDPRFYHLDTCFAAVDERTAVLHPPAFRPEGLAALRGAFERVVEVDEEEAVGAVACNLVATPGGPVLVEERAPRLGRDLEALGYEVVALDTGEFLRSGGSLYCMKQWRWDGRAVS